MSSQPTLLTCVDGFSRLKSRVSFLDFACHSSRLRDALSQDEYDGLLWFHADLQDELDRLLSCLQQITAVSIIVACLLACVSLPAVAQTSTSIVQDGRLVDITIPGDASLEQLKEIRLISKDVLTILEKQLDHEETKVNHAAVVNAVFWYALLISPLLAFAWLLYKVKKLTVQTQQSLFIESRSSLPGQQLGQQPPLVMLPMSQALERRV